MTIWLALLLLALWPHGLWATRRVLDGSDEPLGLAALTLLGVLLWRARRDWRPTPDHRWAWAALGLAGGATASLWCLPPLMGAMLAALALACALRALLSPQHATMPLIGLAVLALPVISSLQFYAGHPLRVLTAQLSTWILQALGWSAARSGTAMLVEGQLIVVDAPCSGVQMVWMAYFCALTVAAWRGASDRELARRLPWVSVWVLLGNVLRNTVLVALQAQGHAPSPAMHQGVGLAVLVLVCLAVTALMPGCRARALAPSTPSAPTSPEQRRVLLATWTPLLLVFALLPLAHGDTRQESARGRPAAPEWPRSWEGQPLRPLALSAVEQRFASRFPGHIARVTDGRRVLVWRQVNEATRMLHPAADCYRGLGYTIAQTQLERDGTQRLWRCFIAERGGQRQRVCEQIVDAQGRTYTDTSSWYWGAMLGQSTGPWRAVTTATPL